MPSVKSYWQTLSSANWTNVCKCRLIESKQRADEYTTTSTDD
jgi:hypothetical protein